jgi:hypothetical protein
VSIRSCALGRQEVSGFCVFRYNCFVSKYSGDIISFGLPTPTARTGNDGDVIRSSRGEIPSMSENAYTTSIYPGPDLYPWIHVVTVLVVLSYTTSSTITMETGTSMCAKYRN